MLRSVDDVSDSDEEVEVANPHPNPGICLKAIDEVSSASSAGAEGQKKRSKNKRLKRKRTSTELPSMKERLAGPSCVKGLLSKSCKKCSQNCIQKFSSDANLDRLQKFREHWVSLGKQDQDSIVIWLAVVCVHFPHVGNPSAAPGFSFGLFSFVRDFHDPRLRLSTGSVTP
jgi:hypothetical protein